MPLTQPGLEGPGLPASRQTQVQVLATTTTLHAAPGKQPPLSKPRSLNRENEDLLGTWVDQGGLPGQDASELGSDEQECAGTQMVILLWGKEMTGQAHLTPWRVMKKNSQRSDPSALIVYSFIKHLGHPRDLSHPETPPGPAES